MHFVDISTSKSGPRSSVVNTFEYFWLAHVLRATAGCTFSRSQLPKVVRQWCAFNMLTSKYASRHNGVHFLNILTSKSVPSMTGVLYIYVHFDFKMCFAQQRRALFEHLNFQKWSEPVVFYTFWLQNVRHATAECNFFSLPAKWLPSGATRHWKNSLSWLFYLFERAPLLSADSFSAEPFSFLTVLTTVAALVHKSEVWLLSFLRSYLSSSYHILTHAAALCIPSHPKTFVTTLCSNSLAEISLRGHGPWWALSDL